MGGRDVVVFLVLDRTLEIEKLNDLLNEIEIGATAVGADEVAFSYGSVVPLPSQLQEREEESLEEGWDSFFPPQERGVHLIMCLYFLI